MAESNSSYNLALPFLLASQSQKHVTLNECLILIDNLLMLAVKSRALNAPPSSPSEGDRYLISAAATGGWSGKNGLIAAFNNLGWVFYPPKAGFICYVADENAVIFFDGTDWKHLSLTATDFQNLVSIGIGTEADANNPIAAKINNALFSAKYNSDSGNGDILFKLNKEVTNNTASFIFQNNWSGRAEFGLVGNDDFDFKTSSDGSNWRTSFGINNSNGYLKPLVISQNINASQRPELNSYTDLRIVGRENTYSIIALENSGGNGAAIIGRSAGGTLSAPTQTIEGQTFITLAGAGRTNTQYLTSNSALFFMRASENWTDSAQGSYLGWAVTPSGSTTRINALKIDSDGVLKPFTDNAFTLGSSSLRFSTIYAATGTINTSDARDKIVESNIDGNIAVTLLNAIEPKIYRWKVGGRVPNLDNYVPIDEYSSPDFKDVEGVRKHAGFLAQDVKAALDAQGLDLAVWGLEDKEDVNSKQWLRPDQMIPILWAAVRELASK